MWPVPTQDSPHLCESSTTPRGWGLKLKIFTGVGIVLFIIVGGIFGAPVFGEPGQSAWESANTAGLEAYRQGRYSDAKQWFFRALTEAERSGKPDPAQAMTLNNLAAVHEALGEIEDAELRYRQSLFIIEAIQGPNHPDLISGLNNLALLYVQDGKFQQAEPLLIRSLTILESHLGEAHAHLIPSLMILAQLTRSQGRLKEAEKYYARALKIADSELDSRHHQTASILRGYAALLRQMDRDTEASLLEERAQAIREPSNPGSPGP